MTQGILITATRKFKMKVMELLGEKWAEPAEVHHTGENTEQSVAELRKERDAAKKRGDTTTVKKKDFAIRAKTGWGKA